MAAPPADKDDDAILADLLVADAMSSVLELPVLEHAGLD
jgi:hypothetical protein